MRQSLDTCDPLLRNRPVSRETVILISAITFDIARKKDSSSRTVHLLIGELRERIIRSGFVTANVHGLIVGA
jgi:hypothetical protein